MTQPDDIAAEMDGRLRRTGPGRTEALLPSPRVQNHAPFLSPGADGLECLWFGGSLEDRSDIDIWRARLAGETWSAPERLTDDPDRSEQNPVQFHAPDGRVLLIHTAQEGGNQDGCALRIREVGGPPEDLPLPRGTFVRGRSTSGTTAPGCCRPSPASPAPAGAGPGATTSPRSR